MRKEKSFKLTNLAVENKITIYIAIIIIVFMGVTAYISTPKEMFPEITFPYFSVTTVYPGTSPSDMENLVTRHIENELKNVDDIKNVYSKSLQDVSMIFIEFETYADDSEANQDVKDAVDKAKTKLPSNLLDDPEVMRIELSEFPILFINLSGDLSIPMLKKYADNLQEEIESLSEVSRADIVGALTREIQINADLYKMQAADVSFDQIAMAVSNENLTISGGTINMDDMERTLRIVGEFDNYEQIGNILLKDGVYIKDVADYVDGYEDRESYSRLFNKNVVTLNIIKKSGENLINAVDKSKEIIEAFKKKTTDNLIIDCTGDQSIMTRNSVSNLLNTIVVGFLVVVLVLMFFMGIDNAMFAGVAIPLSMLISFIILPVIGFTLNIVVLMALIIALGILVDNSIVVVENIYRHFYNTPNLPIIPATKRAAGEVAIPIMAGTFTTIAPFIVLSFWPGIMGEFMKFIPITLIICLLSSLFVAYIINPVFAISFMKYKAKDVYKPNIKKRIILTSIAIAIAIPCYMFDNMLLGNIIAFFTLMFYLVQVILRPLINKFQATVLPALINAYKSRLTKLISGKKPQWIVLGAVALFIFTIVLIGTFPPKIVLMPATDPSQVFVYLSMPSGTSIEKTDSIAKILETRVDDVLGKNNPDVEFINTNIAIGAGKDIFERTTQHNLGKITIGFVEYKYRTGPPTTVYLNSLRKAMTGIPGAEIIVEMQQMGPPTGAPISIEINGDDYTELIALEKDIQQIIESSGIEGIEELKSNLDVNKPEIIVDIDRTKANKLGLSTAYIGSTIRTALYGREVSKYREGEDEYNINLRLQKKYRDNIDAIMNMKMVVPGENDGPNKEIPISAVANIRYTNSYGGVVRKDNKRMITLSSNVLKGYNANEIIENLKEEFKENLKIKAGYEVNFGGEQDDMKESTDFLSKAMVIALALIFLILVTQFNSVYKPIIVLSQVILSFIGIFLGIIIFGMDVSVIMTGMGIVAVAGIVVNNGILLIDYTDQLIAKGMGFRRAIVQAGAIRLTPVLLTAISTILGLLPLGIGMNINFVTLFTDLDPNIYWGGDSAQFWAPLAWTIVYGLTFATFLTLLVVPSMYYIMKRQAIQIRIIKRRIMK